MRGETVKVNSLQMFFKNLADIQTGKTRIKLRWLPFQ